MRSATNIMPLALIMGAIAGLLVGGFLNIFNVPVMEWAISLEEAAAAADTPAGDDALAVEVGGISVSLGMQRVGLMAGMAVLGVVYAALFTGLYHLVRRAAPGWNVWAWAVIAGLLGFWAVSLFTQIKYPLNPPGIGEESSLLSRQAFQFLFILLSLAAAAAGCWLIALIHQSGVRGGPRLLRYAGVALAYAVVALVLAYAIPGNPDPVPEWLPESLVIMFRSFSALGHLLLWLTIALGVAGYIRYQERGVTAAGRGITANAAAPAAQEAQR